MTFVVMAYVVMAYVVMALSSYGFYSYGLCSYGAAKVVPLPHLLGPAEIAHNVPRELLAEEHSRRPVGVVPAPHGIDARHVAAPVAEGVARLEEFGCRGGVGHVVPRPGLSLCRG